MKARGRPRLRTFGRVEHPDATPGVEAPWVMIRREGGRWGMSPPVLVVTSIVPRERVSGLASSAVCSRLRRACPDLGALPKVRRPERLASHDS